LSSNAKEPLKSTPESAGFDLYSAYEYQIEPNGKILAKTDIQLCLPYGCYGRLAPRSGLTLKHCIDVKGIT